MNRDIWAEVIEDARREKEASARAIATAREMGRSSRGGTAYHWADDRTRGHNLDDASCFRMGSNNLGPGCRWNRSGKHSTGA